MNVNLPAIFKKLLPKKITDQYAGFSIKDKAVCLVKLQLIEGDWVCVLAEEFPLQSPEQLPLLFEQIINSKDLSGVPSTIIIPSKKVESIQIDLSELPPVDTQAALPWKIKELVSIPPQEMICDYIEMDIQPFGQPVKAQVMVTSRQYLESFLNVFHEQHVPVKAITTEQFVLARMQSSEDAAQLLFVQHKNLEAILLILKNQQICFARKIRGTDTVINMPPDQVKEYGADMIAIEIQRSVDYYESQLKQPPIKNVLIAMAGENESLLIDILNTSLPIKTVKAEYAMVKDDTGTLSLNYLASLGGALYALQEEAK